MSFFELSTPRHMLEKARREHQRLLQRFDIDNVFNFLVTANHIRDYVERLGSVPQSALDTFAQDQDIKDCRDLCDKGKHVILTKRANPSTRIMSNHVGVGMVGQMMVGVGDTWLLESGDRKVDVGQLVERVIQKWESFFLTHSM